MPSCGSRDGPRAASLLAVCGLFFALAGCGESDPVWIDVARTESQTITVDPGAQFAITLQTIGPGAYESPPSISSPAVDFVDVTLVSPYVPAGPTQRFRFRAVEPGRAVIVFRHTGTMPEVRDTVQVR